MQVPPHMREAGGGSCPLSPPTPIVGNRCGTQMWAAGMGSSPLIVGKLGCGDSLTFNRDGLCNARAV